MKPILLTVAAVSLALLPASQGRATEVTPDGSFRLVFDTATNATTYMVPGFATFNLYLSAPGLAEISAWEARVSLPPGWTILGTSLDPVLAIDIGGEPGNYIVGLGSCMAQGPTSYLAAINMGYFASPTAPVSEFCLGPSDPSSVANAGPAYVDCNDQLFVAAVWDDLCDCAPAGCAVANRLCTVATEASSFGELKASAAP